MVTNYTIIERPSQTIVGIECRTSNSLFAAPIDIPKHWGNFHSQNIIQKIPNKISEEIIALYCDYEGDYTKPYSLVIGCAVSSLADIPEGMIGKVIPAATYAFYRAQGDHPHALITTWKSIWQQKDLKRTYTGDFEVYGEKFAHGKPPEIEVFVAIARQ